MSQTVPGQVPVLSMGNMDKADFAAAFGGSFQRFGFAMVKDHGMDQALITSSYLVGACTGRSAGFSPCRRG